MEWLKYLETETLMGIIGKYYMAIHIAYMLAVRIAKLTPWGGDNAFWAGVKEDWEEIKNRVGFKK